MRIADQGAEARGQSLADIAVADEGGNTFVYRDKAKAQPRSGACLCDLWQIGRDNRPDARVAPGGLTFRQKHEWDSVACHLNITRHDYLG